MVKCRKCHWCFKEISDDFIVTSSGESLHLDCYREADSIIELSKKENAIVH